LSKNEIIVGETKRVAPHASGKAATDSSGWSGSLPDDVLQATAGRLAMFCAIAAGTWILGVIMQNVRQSDAVRPFPWPGNLIAGVEVAILLVTFGFIKKSARRNCQLTIDLGLGLLIINAIGVALLNSWVPLADPLDTRFVSWIGVIILGYAITAPSSPRKTFVAALIAALMDPLAIGLAALRGVRRRHGSVHRVRVSDRTMPAALST